MELEIPSVVLETMRRGVWPRGRVRGALLQMAAPFIADTDLELVQTPEEMREGGSGIADLQSLRQFADSVGLGEQFRVKRGSGGAGPVELPWLDVEQALVIGGGADYGDDTWVVLDYRANRTDPRVVVNAWSADRPPQVEWRELAPSVTSFLQMLGVGEMR